MLLVGILILAFAFAYIGPSSWDPLRRPGPVGTIVLYVPTVGVLPDVGSDVEGDSEGDKVGLELV